MGPIFKNQIHQEELFLIFNAWCLNMERTRCTETSVAKCQPTPRKSRRAAASVLSDVEDTHFRISVPTKLNLIYSYRI
jgi:hypothetical protein